jgi:hypothetical protein
MVRSGLHQQRGPGTQYPAARREGAQLALYRLFRRKRRHQGGFDGRAVMVSGLLNEDRIHVLDVSQDCLSIQSSSITSGNVSKMSNRFFMRDDSLAQTFSSTVGCVEP